jgi:hypothetical protein
VAPAIINFQCFPEGRVSNILGSMNKKEFTDQERFNIRGAAEQIKKRLASGKASEAIMICDYMLAANPGHALFTALKLEAEDQKRESRLEYIRTTSAEVENVSDLDLRVTMLQEATKRYPSESQLDDLLRNATAKRDLLNAVLAEARKAESRGMYAEALERLFIVREFHPSQPGLRGEIQRLKQLAGDEAEAVDDQSGSSLEGSTPTLLKPVVLVLLGVGFIGILFLAYTIARRVGFVGGPRLTTVEIAATPEDAEILVDGKKSGNSKVRIQLPAGSHTVSAALPGYETQTVPLSVASEPQNVTVQLQAVPLDLRVVSDQTTGHLWIDDEEKGEIGAAGILVPGIGTGTHTITVRSPLGESKAVFDFRPGEVPVAVSLPPTPMPAVLFVGTSKGQSHADCNCAPATLKLAGSEEPLKPGGVDLSLPEGDYSAELSILGGKKLTVASGSFPAATLAMYWGEKRVAAPTDNTDALLAQATTMMNKGQYQDALARVKQALSKDPRNEQAVILQNKIERLMAISP